MEQPAHLIASLREGMCVEDQRCRVRDARSGCDCAIIADYIEQQAGELDRLRAALAAAQAAAAPKAGILVDWREAKAEGFAAGIEAAANKALSQPGYLPPYQRAAEIRALQLTAAQAAGEICGVHDTARAEQSIAAAKRVVHEQGVKEGIEAAQDSGTDRDGLLEEINKVRNHGGVDAYTQDVLKRCYRVIRALRPPAASAVLPSEKDVIRAWWGDLELCDSAAVSWRENAGRVLALWDGTITFKSEVISNGMRIPPGTYRMTPK